MRKKSNSAVTPRNGFKLIVGIVARISGCENQTELSLDDQIDHAKEVIREYFDGEIEFRIIQTINKGERLDRPELAEVENWARSSEFDFLIFEDVGRLVRGTAALILCGIAVDHGTRVLSPNDYIDTAEGSWEDDVLEACREHMKHNEHTSRRIKQKKMNRFKKFGGATPVPILGYIKPDGAKTFSDWRKDEEKAPYIEEGNRILQRTLNGEAVAEYFNENNVPTGPYCRNKDWDGRMALRFYRNPILKGMPKRGSKHTEKQFETGRRVSVPNPQGPTYREEPHLTFIPPDEFDALQIDLDTKNSKYKRKLVKNGVDSRHRVPKKRTRSFGQHAHCWYCCLQMTVRLDCAIAISARIFK